MYLHIGNCIILKDMKISRIDNIDPDLTINDFKSKVAEKINFIKENIELFFGGKILKDTTTLKENGIEEGFVLNVLQKKEKETPVSPHVVLEDDIKALVRAFQILDKRNAQRHVLQKLKKNDVLESIISTTPGLIDDDAAIVILQHPELMSKLGDVKAVKRLVKEHPSLATVARNLVAAVQNDTRPSPMASTSASSPLNSAFNVGSDDEDMEVMGNGDAQNRTLDPSEEGEQSQPVNVITPSQVAAALASTAALTNRTQSAGSSSSNITPEMMSAALQQAMASATPETLQQSSSATTSQPTKDEMVTLAKLDQLRRLGFVNDAINIQALQLSNGDVETAVNLILGGLHEDS